MSMRLVIDTLIAVLLASLLAIILLNQRWEKQEIERTVFMQQVLNRLREQAIYRNALENAETINSTTFSMPISTMLFDNDMSLTNVLVPGDHPWMDTAPPGDVGDHPPDPVITNSNQACFWTNPIDGTLRARVPAQLTEKETLDLYNLVNNTSLTSLPRSVDPKRAPRPLSSLSPAIVRTSPEIPAGSIQPHMINSQQPVLKQDNDPAEESGYKPTLRDVTTRRKMQEQD